MLQSPESSVSQAPLQTAVLMLIFNRPDTTRQVFEAVRKAQPARLYIAADGPRTTHPDDQAQCAAARSIVAGIDWPCEVFTLFRTTNLNCGVGPATALDWFFSHEEEGIILEDDCVPAASFFPFCQELLARYRHDTRVMHIGGNNFGREAQQPLSADSLSYYFSHQINSWGWATWRRAWQLFDFNLSGYQQLLEEGKLHKVFSSWAETKYRLSKFESILSLPQPCDVWDYQWHYTIVAHSGLAVVPAVHLVENIGFGNHGTHTMDAQDSYFGIPTTEIKFPLRHPEFVLADQRRDTRRFQEFLLGRITTKVRRLVTGFRPASSGPVPAPAPAAPVPNTQLA
ncbi:hemolytic protein HlpA [Hymenobacter seoulensis]